MRVVYALVGSIVATVALAAPSLVYPLQAQRPPVARLGAPWTFTILPGTFSGSSSLSISSTLPSWATFNAASGTFSGTPPASQSALGSTQVTVVAESAPGSGSASDSFTLLVDDPSNDPPPYIRLPIADQLASAAAVSGGGSLTPDGALKVPPQWSFSFGFQQYTAENSAMEKMYYSACERGTTTLPSWIKFDNSTVTFYGLAPYQKGNLEVVLFASSRFGYGDVAQTFRIDVVDHSFELLGSAALQANHSTFGPLPSVNVTPGGPVNYVVPLDGFRIDNSTISRANLSSVSVNFASANLSSDLTFDAASLTITGDVPATFATGGSPLPIPLTFVDQYNDSLATTVALVVSPSLFNLSALPGTIDVQAGQKFSQDLTPYLAPSSASSSNRRRALPPALNGTNSTATISPSAAASWLSFDSSSFSLTGTAPSLNSSLSISNASVVVDATAPSTGAISRATFVVQVVKGEGNTTAPTGGSSGHSLSHDAKLGLGLGLGLGIPLLIALVLLALWYYRRHRDSRAGGAGGAGPAKRRSSAGLVISHPRPLAPASASVFGGASTVTVVTPSLHVGDKEWGEKDVGEKKDESMALPTSVVQHAASPAATASTSTSTATPGLPSFLQQPPPPQPKRFDVMGVLFRSESGASILDSIRAGVTGKGKGKGKAKERDQSQRSLPQETSLFGLGIDEATGEAKRIVVVSEGGKTDGNRRSTYRENSGGSARTGTPTDSAGRAIGASGRVSSWESGASSSLFYSSSGSRSGSDTGSTGPHRRTTSRSGSFGSPASLASMSSSRRVGATPASVPQRRRDFLPLPLKSPTASPGSSPALSPTRDTYDVTHSSGSLDRAAGGLERADSGETEESAYDGADVSDPAGGIRMVASHSDSSSGQGRMDDSVERSEMLLEESVVYDESRHFQQFSSPSRSGSYPSDSPSVESFQRPPPRLVPFTSERRPPPFSRTFTSQASLAARRPSEPMSAEDVHYDDDAVEDAWEEDEEGRPRSGVYAPPDWEGSPTTSVVFYPRASQPPSSHQRDTMRYPSGSAYSYHSRTSFDTDADGQKLSGSGMRYVGSVASTVPSPYMPSPSARGSGSHYSHDVTGTPRSDVFSSTSRQSTEATSRPRSSVSHKRASSYLEPLRVQLYVNEPFRFVPRLDPPPFASITSSPGRGGPPRATYSAWIEVSSLDADQAQLFANEGTEDGLAPLPEWVRFDGSSIEMHGLARRGDAGAWPVVVVERKALRTPGSPSRSGKRRSRDDEDSTEQIVGRFELIVGDRHVDALGEGEEGEEGELRLVTY
ncbi:polarity establishment/cellular polarization [Rhodotorula toruloides]